MDVNTKIASPVAGSVADGRNHHRDVNGEFHQGILRKREPTGAYNNEHPTRYNIQKTKDFVKRQKPKGQYHGGAETNSQVVEERFPEYGSVLVPIPRSKRENGNHLLNFRYKRNMTRDLQSRDVGRHSNNNRSLPPIQRHKYNKDQFVLTSCQFVVMRNGDYSSHLRNPDLLVDWKLVEQVKFYNSESLSICPICLEAPYASKMTRCGHVYCWPCILRHLHVHEETDHVYECPICHEYICKSDLKSVVEITRSAVKLGDTINLRLMRREKNSLFATPVERAIQPPTNFLSVSENNVNGIYSKLLIASVQDIVYIIECERSELQLALETNSEMILYIQQALTELSKREEKLLLKATESKDASSTENTAEKEDDTSLGNELNANRDDNKPLTKQSSIDSVSSDNQSTSTSPKYSYFYQAEDGQHIYLHAANVKMLEMQYGSLEFCPPVITGRLLEKEASICTEDLRRRLRYLCHLPLTCPFELAEIELKPPLVSEDVLHVFDEQLKSRQKYRQQREREERKREKKIKEEENRQIGIYPTPNIEIASYQHFPQLQSELFPNELSIAEPAATSSMAGSPPLSTCDDIVTRQEAADHSSQTRSFADITKSMSTMLITQHNKSAWPAVKSKTYSNIAGTSGNDDEVSSSTAATRANNKSVRDAWPIVKSKTYSGIWGTSPGKDEESNATNVWSMKSKESTSSTSSNEDEKKPCASDQANDDGNTVGKKKKKKGKGTVLLTTGMTSGYSI
ncbi:RING finger protein 10 [Pseudomyrmex gracilis]|uniref:RING finger protein 10 n=1 Tax=Pseudomyrmex gracilis TaxID=219809 RepID=UPI000995D088|nr:RING finger protein 10 [Pseudomyrmex gracilis]